MVPKNLTGWPEVSTSSAPPLAGLLVVPSEPGALVVGPAAPSSASFPWSMLLLAVVLGVLEVGCAICPGE